jgi:hypothetical protein
MWHLYNGIWQKAKSQPSPNTDINIYMEYNRLLSTLVMIIIHVVEVKS